MRPTHKMPAPSQIDAIWWLHPGKLVLFFMLPIYLFVTFVVPALWPELIVLRARVYMDAEYVLLGACSLLLLGGGALFGARLRLGGGPEPKQLLYHVRERVLLFMGGLATLAYLIWFGPAIARGELLLEREELNQMPGVTSFTQLGVPFVVVYLYASRRAGQQFSWPVRFLFRLLLAFTVLRVYMWSERLALIEIAVPAAVLLLAYYRPERPLMQTAFTLVRRYGPFLGIPVLLVFFGATEVVRSWTSYSQKQDITLVDFIISRVATYYYTALNNGAGLLATSTWPDFEFLSIGEWVYRLPFGIGQTFWDSLGRAGMPHDEFLRRFADVEFNNMSGIYPVYFDIGIALGLLYFGGLGVVMGLAYGEAKRGGRLGTLIFPSMLVACIEVLRIMYLNNTRCFLVFVGAFLVVSQMRPVQQTVAASRPSAPTPSTVRGARGPSRAALPVRGR